VVSTERGTSAASPQRREAAAPQQATGPERPLGPDLRAAGPAQLLALQRAIGNRALAASLSARRTPAAGGQLAVQRKLEFAQHHAVAPAAAIAAVKADYERYAAYQQSFENKLGVGLFNNPIAHQGADEMLRLMLAAMTAAGFDKKAQEGALAAKVKKGDTSIDLGAVLTKDVAKALTGGNLREKMGMVYQARFDISKAIDKLTEEDRRDLIGDEMFSDEMTKDVEKTKGAKQNVSYAVLKRRQSVSSFKRTAAKSMQGVIRPEDLEGEGIGLSDREKGAAQQVGAKKFYAGREFYVVDPGARKAEVDKLRLVVAGLSGSTDMYFHIAKHLKMDEANRRKFRLAALGQMLVNQDHSYHEIMHVAKTQGELADYADELPIGYTTLAPLNTDQTLGLTGLPDFPGDAQVRSVGVIGQSSELLAAAGHGKKSKTYPAILALLDAYHLDPTREKVLAVVAAIDAFVKDKKPGRLSTSATRQKYATRLQVLNPLKAQCMLLVKQWDALSKVPRSDLAAFAQKSMEGADAKDIARMNRLISQESAPGTNMQAKDFRSTSADAGLNTSAMHLSVSQQKQIMQITDDRRLARTMGDKSDNPVAVDINANLKTDLEGFVEANKLIIDVVKGDLQPKKLTIKERTNPVLAKKNQDIQDVVDNPRWQQEPEDFSTNIDLSALDALSKPEPTDPVGKMLKRMENKPVPQELQAINAYAQPGFYVIMNKVLNKSANRKFMQSAEGKQWWAAVPAEVKQLVSLAVSALRKLEPYTGGPVYRGQPGFSREQIDQQLLRPKAKREEFWTSEIGSTYPFSQFVSTSKRPHSSYIVKEKSWMAMHIEKPKTGVDISAFSNTLEEREVLFPPGTTFRVTKVEDKFKTPTEPLNRYSDAPLAVSTEPGRVKVTLEEV
jgi:hypothetical protein